MLQHLVIVDLTIAKGGKSWHARRIIIFLVFSGAKFIIGVDLYFINKDWH